ncbi:MAG: PAS domain-containing protein, partial [Phormidesmis sp. CAN_BIN44]|nr:PAS domain-containing protein [Phormidesmis sp. CAN_BIN44]
MNTQLHRTILIVEDSPEDREMYRRYLMRDRDYAYTIVEASLGKEGLDLWHQHQPDAVLLDYRLPDLDGLEFLAALQPQQPLPIVMVTGVGNETIAVQAIKAGAQDYLVKGQITPEGLKLALDATIKTVQLQTQLHQRIDRERVITQIAQKVSRSLDLNEILHTTVTEVRQFLQTDRVVVFQVEPDGNGRVVAESVGAEWRSILSDQISDPCFVESYVNLQRQGRVTVKADIYDGSIDPCHVQLLAGLQVRANLVVPILHDDQFWGVLIAHSCAAPRQWQPLEIDLLQQLSTQVSVAIRQAELYQQSQHELAERKRTEDVLRSSEERLRLGLQAARMGTWDWNIAENRIIWSANMEALFGLAPGEFDGSYDQFVARLHPDDRDRVLEAINAAMTPGANYDIEFRVLYPDGTIRWALSQGKVFYDVSGQAIRMSGVDVDITIRKQTEESLRQSEEFRKQVLESSNDCIKVLDLDAQVLYVNPGGLCLLEIDDLTPYLNTKWVNFWQDESRQEIEAAIAVAKSNEVSRFQGFCLTAKGTPKWWDVIVTPMLDEEGQVSQLLATSRDITDRVQVERDRERILQQKQAALAESERVNRIKDEFLAILSHELRSPLNPILGWTKLLQTRKLDETKTIAALATIERNAKAQCQLIDDLLDMARVLRGKLSLNVCPVNLLLV